MFPLALVPITSNHHKTTPKTSKTESHVILINPATSEISHGFSGWFFKHEFLFSIINGMSSFPLTNSYFSRWLSHHQPDQYPITHHHYNYGRSQFLMGKTTISMAKHFDFPWMSPHRGSGKGVWDRQLSLATWRRLRSARPLRARPRLSGGALPGGGCDSDIKWWE